MLNLDRFWVELRQVIGNVCIRSVLPIPRQQQIPLISEFVERKIIRNIYEGLKERDIRRMRNNCEMDAILRRKNIVAYHLLGPKRVSLSLIHI